MLLPVGTLLQGGKYRIEEHLGSGGFGCTYKAYYHTMGCYVAIKEFFVKDCCDRGENGTVRVVLPNKVELVRRLRSKFIDEARTLFGTKMHHPNIVRVSDVFEENDTVYYAMDYIDGCSLADLIAKKGHLAGDGALGYIRQIAAALEHLHANNCLHLDVKPANIMIDRSTGRAILIDFGVSKQYDEVNGENTSTLMGLTPGYAPIEQSGRSMIRFNAACDIYSLGATLYKAVTGDTPIEASLRAGDKSLCKLLYPEHVSHTIRGAIDKAMQISRSDRPQSVGEFLALLENGNVKTENGKEDDDGATLVALDNKSSSTPVVEEAEPARPVILTKRSAEESQSAEKEKPTDPVIPNGSEKSPQKPSGKKWFIIAAVAIIAVVAVILGINSGGGEAPVENPVEDTEIILARQQDNGQQQAAEQQRIEAERTAQAKADSIAAENKRLKEELKAKEEADSTAAAAAEAAEQQRIEAERKAQEEAERKLKEEAERKRKEAAQTRGTINGHEYVDLGLSVKWATCNVGASTPADYGDYYAWGETSTKSSYTSDNSTTYGKQMSSIAGNATYDVARKKWGSPWRLPTKAEFDELIDNCTWTWTTQNGHNGYKVTSKKNGNSIFLPAAGWRNGASSLYQGGYGCYWSATTGEINSNGAYCLYFNEGGRGTHWRRRDYGRSVRPVSD